MKRYSLVLLALLITLTGSLSTSTVSAVSTNLVEPVLVIGGSVGSAPGFFNTPDSLYVDENGIIYAGDTDNLRVQLFSSSGSYITEYTGFTPTSEVAGNEVQGIGELSNGTIVVIEKAGNLYYFDKSDGTMTNKVDLRTLTTLGSWDTQGLAVDTETDEVYISNQPEQIILVIASDGSLARNITLPASATPENIALDKSRDRIYISTEGFTRIDYYSFNGSVLGNFGGADVTGNYEGLAVDPLGNILAVSEGPNSASSNTDSRIIVFDPSNFTAIYAWGSSGHTAEGEFLSPDGIAYDSVNHRVLIADQGNARIQIFDYLQIVKNASLYSDSTAPTVSDQSDITFQEGTTTAQTLTWNISDGPFGGSYKLSIDGTVDSSGKFGKDGTTISKTVTQLVPGTYTYEINVTDAFDNFVVELTTVTVTEEPTQTSTSETTSETATSPSETSDDSESPYPWIWSTVFVALIPIIVKKRK